MPIDLLNPIPQDDDSSPKEAASPEATAAPPVSVSPPLFLPASPKTRGAPTGNRTALKHGFYSRAWRTRDRKDLQSTHQINLTEEIDLMRVSIRRLAESISTAPSTLELSTFLRTLSLAFVSLNRMVRTQQQITPEEDETELRKAITQARLEFTHDLGLDNRFPRA